MGCHVRTEQERGNEDPHAIMCYVPDKEELDPSTFKKVMHSKSSKRTYTVGDVACKPVGRVQYFLNNTFSQLLEERRIVGLRG